MRPDHLVPRVLRGLAVLAAASIVLASCGDDGDDTSVGSTSTSEPPTTDTTPADDGDDGTDMEPVDVGLYFVQEVLEPSQGGVVEAVAATSRTVDAEADVGSVESALTALLEGPTSEEGEIGMTSAVPAGTRLLGLEVADGVARVDLDATFEDPAGAFGDTLRVAQVVFTLTAFDDIDTVRFAIDGDDREIVGTHGVGVAGADGDGIGRDDLPEARPPILVERPAPRATVTSPLVVAGESNTFEATLRWALTDPEGEILEEGFATATAGNGTWGTFDFEIDTVAYLDGLARGGLGSLILWEDSAEDGRQTNIVEVPVDWPAP